MKKQTKKLALRAETVRALDRRLDAVTGGASAKCVTHVSCPSIAFCHTLDDACDTLPR